MTNKHFDFPFYECESKLKNEPFLRQPIGDRVYFAGEATARDWGSVDGARDSGIITAKKIIET